jgi:hypothetical protein
VFDRTVVEVMLGVGLVLALYGPIGVAVGALVRNQIAAVVAALAWTFIVEQLVVALWPEVGRWLPGGAPARSSSSARWHDPGRPAAGVGRALLLVAYAVVLSVVAATVTLRRDLT